jgi:hypothetical protein
MPKRVFVFDVDDLYEISPKVVSGLRALTVASAESPKVSIAVAPSLTKSVDVGTDQP